MIVGNLGAFSQARFNECLPYMCGAYPGDTAGRYACAQDGYSGAQSPCSPMCQPFWSAISINGQPASSVCGAYAAPAASAPSPSAPAPGQVTPVPATPAPSSQVVTTPAPARPADQNSGGAVSLPKITVETSAGPVQVSADQVPGVSDLALSPAVNSVRIPNIWDQLDPSQVSQFAYRGLATSLPVFFSPNYRQFLRDQAALTSPSVQPAGSTLVLAGSSWLPWIVLLGAVAVVSSHEISRRRSSAPKKRRAAAHG
jgi:hypothetical protein